jgi:hypothetical protein
VHIKPPLTEVFLLGPFVIRLSKCRGLRCPGVYVSVSLPGKDTFGERAATICGGAQTPLRVLAAPELQVNFFARADSDSESVTSMLSR